ncbi:MAG: hypothetical protein ACOC5K_04635 [Chloroflexota bacterium]
MVTAGRLGCTAQKGDGTPCNAPRLSEGRFCLMHDPDHQKEAAEARRLGGLRRRRERTVTGAYQLEGLGSVGEIRRLLEIAVLDTLGLENSVSRARTLAYLAQVSMRLLEIGELEERVASLEQTVGRRG